MGISFCDSDVDQTMRSTFQQLPTGITLSSLALAGALGASATQPGNELRIDPTYIAVAMIDATAIERADSEPLSARQMTQNEMIGWARSMMGGDASDMVDL